MKIIKPVDYIFWILTFIYTNSGGIQDTLGIYEIGGRINLNDLIFFILSCCYLVILHKEAYIFKSTYKLMAAIIIFAFYFIFVFGYLTPRLKDPSTNVVFNFIKLRFSIYNFFIFIYSFKFWQRSSSLFLKVLLFMGIPIMLLFLQEFITGVSIIPHRIYTRGFIDVDRHLLIRYALLGIYTPLALIIIIFNYKSNYTKWVILGFILITITWILSLTRRHIIGLFIDLFIVIFIYIYINPKFVTNILRRILKIIVPIILITVLVYLIKPTYLNASFMTLKNTYSIVVLGEEEGSVNQRLGLWSNKTLINEFKQSPLFGTGFNNLWRTREGDKLGYEATDYPFQSALAMSGLVGCMLFLPVYIIIFKVVYLDLRNFRFYNIPVTNIDTVFMLLFFVIMINMLINYVNWFSPISESGNPLFYLYIAFYAATRERFYLTTKPQLMY